MADIIPIESEFTITIERSRNIGARNLMTIIEIKKNENNNDYVNLH